VRENGKTVVYRNEDTGWSFPFYLKFDSSDLSAKAADLSDKDAEGNEQWVAVTHYGWRIRLFTIFPNATKIRPVKGPDVVLIPWFNIVFLAIVFGFLFWVWLKVRAFKAKRIDPITDEIEERVDAVTESVSEDISETSGTVKRLFRKFFGSSKK